MAFLFYIFTLFLSCNQIQTCEKTLWQQIIPLIQKREIHKTFQIQTTLKDCIAQAIIVNGDNPQSLDSEMFHTLKSLHFFSEILPKIACNTLHWGYFELARHSCQITDDLEMLKKRNIFTQYLQSNPEIIQKIQEILQTLTLAESDFLLNFYQKEKELLPSGPMEEGFSYLKELEKNILSNHYTGEIYKLFTKGTIALSIVAAFKKLYEFNTFHKHNIEGVKRGLESIFVPTTYADNIASAWPVSIPWTAVLTIGTLIGATMTFTSLSADFAQASQKQKSLLLFKEIIKASKKIVKIIQKNPKLEQFLPEYSTIQKFAQYQIHPELFSEKVNNFLNLLESYPFNQDEPSTYPLWQGKIYEAFILYEELKNEIVPLWQALGSLDAHICTQSILANHPTFFCIPEWIDNEKPMFQIHNYWHPMISQAQVVKNNIHLGTYDIARNVIITGANAGGKTTAMTAIMLCAIFAQSLGIVPAQTYQATPFTRMHTYLDITTNLSTHESLFIAQANRAKHLYESIKNCHANQKTLTILDEIFTGTRADFAEQASYEFAQKLGTIEKSISLIATHFLKLTELEQTELFINYHASPATINLDGTLNYPYLIIPGISTQNIADIILKNKGLLS